MTVDIEILQQLADAASECRAAAREAHEARKDLRLALKEVEERLPAVRKEISASVNALAGEHLSKAFDQAGIAAASNGLKAALAKWMVLLKDAQDLLELMQKSERTAARRAGVLA